MKQNKLNKVAMSATPLYSEYSRYTAIVNGKFNRKNT